MSATDRMVITAATATATAALPGLAIADALETAPAARPAVNTAAPDNTTPGTLDRPAFLMNCPFSYSTARPNNPWMCDLSDEARQVDRTRAMAQFAQVYNYLASDAFVFLLPTPRGCALQDLVFTANLGVVLEHLPGRDTVVLSNFSSEPRVGEAEVGDQFFRAMGYTTVAAPYKFEGEAELKHLHTNVYAGGYGIRSDPKAYEWMEEQFDMRVIKLREVDEYLYHLDCSVFPVTPEETLVCTELFEEDEVRQLEKVTNVIDVSVDACYAGICNSVRYHNSLLNASNIHSLKAGSKEYFDEIQKNRKLEDIAVRLGLEVSFFNLSEYLKGGALLSCMVMHLNRRSYAFSLI